MSAAVGAWKPAVALGEVHAEALDESARALAAGEAQPAGDSRLAPGDAEAERLREVVQAEGVDRRGWFAACESARLVSWLRVLTLAERDVPGCDAGAKSPVIDIARLLRERDAYPDDLTPWIRSASSNRFLPYGSLADRLRP